MLYRSAVIINPSYFHSLPLYMLLQETMSIWDSHSITWALVRPKALSAYPVAHWTHVPHLSSTDTRLMCFFLFLSFTSPVVFKSFTEVKFTYIKLTIFQVLFNTVIKRQNNQLYEHTCICMKSPFSIHLSMSLRVELTDPMVIMFLTFWGTAKLLSTR